MKMFSLRLLPFAIGIALSGHALVSMAQEPKMSTKSPSTYIVKNHIKWRSGGYITEIQESFDPNNMNYRPGFYRDFDIHGLISSHFYYPLASSPNMSVTSLPYLQALQDVFNGATELDLTILGEAKDGVGMTIGGSLKSTNYLPVNEADLKLAKATSSASLENLIHNIVTTNSPTRKTYGIVLLGLRYARSHQHGEEIAEALSELYEATKPKRSWFDRKMISDLKLGPSFFDFFDSSYNEVRAAAVFAMHFLDYADQGEDNLLLETLQNAKNDKDDLVRSMALESERILLGKSYKSAQNPAEQVNSIIKKCLANLN